MPKTVPTSKRKYTPSSIDLSLFRRVVGDDRIPDFLPEPWSMGEVFQRIQLFKDTHGHAARTHVENAVKQGYVSAWKVFADGTRSSAVFVHKEQAEAYIREAIAHKVQKGRVAVTVTPDEGSASARLGEAVKELNEAMELKSVLQETNRLLKQLLTVAKSVEVNTLSTARQLSRQDSESVNPVAARPDNGNMDPSMHETYVVGALERR